MAWWAAATVLYLSFVSFTWTQAVAGSVVAAGAVALSRAGARAAGMSHDGSLPHLWPPQAVGRILFGELRAVTRRLFTGSGHGRFVAFPAGEPVGVELDTALTFEASLAPNTYLVAVVEAEDGPIVLLHQFAARPQASRSFPRWWRR